MIGSIKFLYVLLLIAVLETLGAAFVCFPSAIRYPSLVLVQASVANDDIKAPAEQRTSSARLEKAKLLLEQLSDEKSNENIILPAIRSSRTSSSTSPVDSTQVVPDTVWWNGNLQQSGTDGSNFVTRWSRGVKVAEPLVKYDPVIAEKLLFRQPTKWLKRNFQIAIPLGWWAVSLASDFIMGRQKFSDCRRERAQQLTLAISRLGPAIIKGGQALASRPDLLPAEYLEELQKLQDDVPRFSNDVAFRTVEQELGLESFEELFELEFEEPVAAASIGQVYKARLVNGDTVAIKIQRPGCEEIVALDLYILRWWSGLYNRIFELLGRDIDLQSIIDDFGELIYREIDYIAEAANAQRFNELYAGVTDVFVPKVYSDLTTRKVLTMEWVDGFRLTDENSLRQYGLDESKLIDALVQCSLRQILENGFFHADPHAGNLLACPDGRLCYLDFGMMSYATLEQRNGFLLAVVNVVNRDWSALVQLYQRLGFIPPETNLQPIEAALERALPDVLNSDISELNIKTIFNKLGDIMYTYPFSLPPFYIAIIRCLGVLEGLALQVDPKARIVSESYPYVASRVLTDKSDDLQEAFRRLTLTKEGHVRWDRLETLLDEAKDSVGYDVSAAADLLTDFLLEENSDEILDDLAEQIVDAADSLGWETFLYIGQAAQAFASNDQVAAASAFRSLQELLNEQNVDGARKKVQENLRNVLPELTPAMQKFRRILALVSEARIGQTDPSRFVPIVRKLSQEPRIRNTANVIAARLGDRVLSRGLRAVFGLPPPEFRRASGSSTVTEDLV